jgi:hypothetical protein
MSPPYCPSAILALLLALVPASAHTAVREQTNEQPMSFQGSIAGAEVWMDIRVPSSDGQVSGSYFYVKHGKVIQLSGTRKGQSLVLEERYKNAITGTMNLEHSTGSTYAVTKPGQLVSVVLLSGTWRSPSNGKTQPVEFSQSDPTFKACVRARAESFSMVQGGSFGHELDSHAVVDSQGTDDTSETLGARPGYEISFCRRRLLGIIFQWSHPIPQRLDPDVGTVSRTFDMKKRKEVDLWAEIDPSKAEPFAAAITASLQSALADIRATASDEQWQEVRGFFLDSAFDVKSTSEMDFYLDEDGIKVGSWDYFGLSLDVALAHGVQREVFVSMPFSEVRQYLKKESVLMDLRGP